MSEADLIKKIEKSEAFKKLAEKIVGQRIVEMKIVHPSDACGEHEIYVWKGGIVCGDVLIVLENGLHLLFGCSEWGRVTIGDKKEIESELR